MIRAALVVILSLLTPITALARESSTPPQAEAGRKVFDYWCAACHGAGIGNPGESRRPGTKALWLKYQGVLPALLTERTDLTPAFIRTTVRTGISVMPFFRKTEIDDQQLEALVAYLSRPEEGVQAPLGGLR